MDAVLLAGKPLRLAGAASPARDAVAAMLACLPRADAAADCLTLWVEEAGPGDSPDALLPPWLAAALADAPEDGAVRVVYGEGGDCAALAALPGAASCARLAADGLHYLARKKTPNLTPLAVSSVLIPLFREIFARQGGALVHGAAVGLPNGRAALLLADSGGGKTTTALALLRSGCKLLADDLAVLDAAAGRPRLWGIAEPLNLTPETLRFFPELRHLPEGLVLPNGKRVLAADAIYPDAYRHEPGDLAALCLIRIGGDAPELRPMPLAEMFGHLVHAHTFAQGQRQHPAAAAACTAALEAAPCFMLHTGPDPLALGPWLVDALSAL